MGWDVSSDMFLGHGMFPTVSSAWDVSSACFILDYIRLWYVTFISILDCIRFYNTKTR